MYDVVFALAMNVVVPPPPCIVLSIINAFSSVELSVQVTIIPVFEPLTFVETFVGAFGVVGDIPGYPVVDMVSPQIPTVLTL